MQHKKAIRPLTIEPKQQYIKEINKYGQKSKIRQNLMNTCHKNQ